jgi:hypothetical protein
MQEAMDVNEQLLFLYENLQYTVDVSYQDGTSHEETCDDDVEKILRSVCDFDEDTCDVDVEEILLSMRNFDDTATKPEDMKEKYRVKNRESAQRARDADRMFAELLLAELQNITETFETYATYIGQLKCHVEAAECSRGLELQCVMHKTNIQQLQKHEVCHSPPKLVGITTKERNRIHAEKSRCKKNKFLQDITDERDACLVTLNKVIEYTTGLESSCSLLNDFNDTGDAFMQLIQIRQKLFQRTCTHTQQLKTLKSRVSFRVVYRSNFR